MQFRFPCGSQAGDLSLATVGDVALVGLAASRADQEQFLELPCRISDRSMTPGA